MRRQAALLFTPHNMLEFKGLSLLDLNKDKTLAWDGVYTPKKRAKSLDFTGTHLLTPLSCSD